MASCWEGEEARAKQPSDEEFLTAALLHDVGKSLGPHDHLAAGVNALDGLVIECNRVAHRQPHARP